VNAVGKPDDRNGPVRFDEGALETERWAARGGHSPETGRNGRASQALDATAPVPYSTRRGIPAPRGGRTVSGGASWRLRGFGLELHPEKTRVIEFGRFAVQRREERSLGKPATFNFLGFAHISAKSGEGKFLLVRQTMRERMRATLRAVKANLRRRQHLPIPTQGRWLRAVVRGYFAYHAVPTNVKALQAFPDSG
jgi:hypothetical protein